MWISCASCQKKNKTQIVSLKDYALITYLDKALQWGVPNPLHVHQPATT